MTTLTFVKLLPSLISWGKAQVVHRRARSGVHANLIVFALVTVAVGIGTAVLLFLPIPEQVRASSSDGRLHLEGFASSESSILAERRNDLSGPFTAVRGPVYDVRFLRAAGGETYRLSLNYEPGEIGDAERADLVFFQYDSRVEAWRVHPSLVDPTTQQVSTEIGAFSSGLWALGKAPHLFIPSVSSVIVDELRAAPPRGAVGYEAFVSYAEVPGDFVLLEQGKDLGGCGGRFASGSSRTLTSKDVTMGDLTYRIGILWELGEGCPVGEKFSSRRK